jgi:hypothetical protein
MSEKMTVIFIEATGHILGIVTRVGNPEGHIAVEDLVGDGLPVRNLLAGSSRITVEPHVLKVQTIDLDSNALLQPFNYILENDVPVLQGDSVQTVGLTTSSLKVTLPTIPSENLTIWAQVEGGPSGERVVLQDTILKNTFPAEKELTVPLLHAGYDYSFLVLIQGYQATIGVATV